MLSSIEMSGIPSSVGPGDRVKGFIVLSSLHISSTLAPRDENHHKANFSGAQVGGVRFHLSPDGELVFHTASLSDEALDAIKAHVHSRYGMTVVRTIPMSELRTSSLIAGFVANLRKLAHSRPIDGD